VNKVKKGLLSSKNFSIAIFIQILVSIFVSPISHSAAPETPSIDTVLASSATSVTVVFYGKPATVLDLKTTYTATSTPDSKTALITALGERGLGEVIVTGLRPSTEYTFTVTATNADGSKVSFPSARITTLAATPIALIPSFGEVKSTSTGFTAKLTNYDSAYTYTIKTDKGTASIAPYDGSITVDNIGYPGELATIIVTSARTGYDSVTATLSARSKQSPEASKLTVKTNPTLVLSGNKAICTVGTFEFMRNSKYLEAAVLDSTVVFLEINSVNASIFSSDDFESTPRFMFPSFTNLVVGAGTKSVVTWDLTGITKKYPIRCKAMAFQEGVSVTGTSSTIVDPSTVVTKAKRTTITCKKGTVVRKVNAVNPKCAPGFTQAP
jgi:hypothetical protein